MTKRFSFNLDAVEEFAPVYRTDTPAPEEYEPVWCERCQKLHHPDPLAYNKTIDRLSASVTEEMDQQILEELLADAESQR